MAAVRTGRSMIREDSVAAEGVGSRMLKIESESSGEARMIIKRYDSYDHRM